MVKKYFWHKIILLVSFLASLQTCATVDIPVSELYQIPATQNKERNPVILIHGIAGAQLIQQETNRIVWGAFNNEGINPNSMEGARAFALPAWEIGEHFTSDDIATIADDVYANAPLEKVDLSFAGVPLSVNVYKAVLSTLGVGGYVDPIAAPGKIFYRQDHYTCFTFFMIGVVTM